MRTLMMITAALLVLGGCNRGSRVDGTYVLRWRDLPDGTVQRPPQIHGCLTLEDGLRNFNVYWEENGKPVSISAIRNYELDKSEYRETNVYNMTARNGGVEYDLEPTSGTSPVLRSDNGIEFPLPLYNEPSVHFTRHGFTATRLNAFVDHWERVD